VPKKSIAPAAPELETLIYEIRGEKVILDSDLARIYGVATKAFNQAVKRNADKFPAEFSPGLRRGRRGGFNVQGHKL
jgi:ORF6N domain